MSGRLIPEEMLRVIREQAEEEYPSECCGMIFGAREEEGSIIRVRKCRNVQDRYHELDPETFTRTSRTAYFIDPRELMAIEKELRERSEAIRIIYHSHPDVGAYFSEEDVRAATADGEPIYPGADYLVLSVMEGRVVDQKLFRWDPGVGGFLEI